MHHIKRPSSVSKRKERKTHLINVKLVMVKDTVTIRKIKEKGLIKMININCLLDISLVKKFKVKIFLLKNKKLY